MTLIAQRGKTVFNDRKSIKNSASQSKWPINFGPRRKPAAFLINPCLKKVLDLVSNIL